MIVIEKRGVVRYLGSFSAVAERLLAESPHEGVVLRSPEALIREWASGQAHVRDAAHVVPGPARRYMRLGKDDTQIAIELPVLQLYTEFAIDPPPNDDAPPIIYPTWTIGGGTSATLQWAARAAHPGSTLWLVIHLTGVRMAFEQSYLLLRAGDGALHRPPVSNVHDGGEICQGSGNNLRARDTLAATVDHIVTTFSNSAWNADLAPAALGNRHVRFAPDGDGYRTLPAVSPITELPVLSHPHYDWLSAL